MENEEQAIFVSVDFGTTYTGVAWMTRRTPIQIINDWPGSGDRGERKVPTTVVYHRDETLSSWGFLSEDDDEQGKVRREFFKIFIDEAILEAAKQRGFSNTPRTAKEARQYAVQFLRQVYVHVKKTIEVQIGRHHLSGWADLPVTFLFSVPTTWTRMGIINSFKEMVRDAGFGVEGPRHIAMVDLTEAEAAAVATLKTSPVALNTGDLFMTVDAGGGTTDMALMRVTSSHANFPQMSQVSAVKGVGIGSTLIDRAFIRLISQRLAPYPEIQGQLPTDFAFRMARSHHFRILKHKFGERVYMQAIFRIKMEGVAYDFSHAGAGIESGRMIFPYSEIQSLFDAQIDGIMTRIVEQLDWLLEQQDSRPVSYMILSGGLGSSVYVRDRIQELLTSLQHPNATHVAVIPCQDPQLVVVRGLLLDLKQRLDTGSLSVLATRIARASYGVVVEQLYSRVRHFDADIRTDTRDRKQWALNQIEWLIEKGQVVDPNHPPVKTFQVYMDEGETTRAWMTEIVISQNEATFLPSSLKQAGASKLCRVRSNLEGLEQRDLVLKHKRGTCFSKGRRFYSCVFEVRVIVGPADLSFELWFGGQRFSRNHEPIAVKWDEAGVMVE